MRGGTVGLTDDVTGPKWDIPGFGVPLPLVCPAFKKGLRFDPFFVTGIKKAKDLCDRLAEQRDAIAHFLIERDGQESHVYVAGGSQLHAYARLRYSDMPTGS